MYFSQIGVELLNCIILVVEKSIHEPSYTRHFHLRRPDPDKIDKIDR